jgi:hypothetical protein
MSTFERYLSIWVGLSILAGLALGAVFPDLFEVLAGWEAGQINLVIAFLIWMMIHPMMVAVNFAALARVHERPKGLTITLAVNWAIKPFTMAVLGIIFFEGLFAPFIEPETAGEYIAGLILLGAAPCTAMVFVWSRLTCGDPNYTLAQVSVNNVVMVVLYAPLVALLLGLTEVTGPWGTLLLSVALFVVVPLVAWVLTRLLLTRRARFGASRGFGHGLHGSAQALLGTGAAGHGGAALRLSGRCDHRAPGSDRNDRNPHPDPVLRYICAGLCGGVALGRTAQCGSPLRADRDIEPFRTGGGCGDRTFRPEFGRSPSHCGRRAGRGVGDAVACVVRQPQTTEVCGMTSVTKPFQSCAHMPAA